LPLLAHRLVELARSSDKLNATIVDGARYRFRHVALGFTVQAREILYLVVVREAETMDAVRFVARLGELQRRALSRQLRPEESQGATIGFSSMARWNVSRHMPILPPHTAVMVAHAATRRGGTAVLGATYDHRVLTGFEVCRLLNQMTAPGDGTAGPALEGEK
jgi:pyruvate/2-oxoglutarate dehydrogenase complex dihydrolipoamide acyltransferase (E2) component